MEAPKITNESIGDEFFRKIRDLAVQTLKNFSRVTNIKLLEDVEIPLIPGYWLAVSQIGASDIKITTKMFFSSKLSRQLLANRTANDPYPNEEFYLDNMSEYMNILSGVIKDILESSGVNAGISIPLVSKGFDEVYSNIPSDHEMSFPLKVGAEMALLRIHVFCSRLDILEKINFESSDDQEHGTIDFF